MTDSGKPGRLSGKVAFVTGAARGQGRSHAVRLAHDGADIIAFDIASKPAECLAYAAATPDDLAETASQVEARDRRVVTAQVDTRDLEALTNALDDAVAELGGLNIVVANAGVVTYAPLLEITPAEWSANIDVNLTGAWHTIRAALPHLLDAGPGGSIVLTGSVCGQRALPFLAPYNAAKHGVLGLARSLALELGPKQIRVNTVNPAGVNTIMSGPDVRERMQRLLDGSPGVEFIQPVLPGGVLEGGGMCEPEDISNAVSFLVSDEAQFITGHDVFIDFGRMVL
jgi:(+)-trans-carveol dehydrogenase